MTKTTHWSQHVTETSNALDIEQGTFSGNDPKAIAEALMRDARRSHRRKSSPYRSAMSMLTFYINRAGRNLPAQHKRTLEQAKTELREAYGTRAKSAARQRG
jgi:membrane-bound lytic murein transglycosylase B